MKISLTLLIERAQKDCQQQHVEVEYPPGVDVKGGQTERAMQADFDDVRRIGFVRNEVRS